MSLETKYHQELMRILDDAEDLPCLPATAVKVFKLCSSENVDVNKLEELLKSDQAITAKLFRTINSAFYGLNREISSIHEVIELMGTQGVKNIVMMSASGNVFDCQGGAQLWKDSIEASLILEGLFRQLNLELDDAQFLTALLHNIGRSIFAKYFSNIYAPVISQCRKLNEIYLSEENLFGMDHRETGGILACNWELPISVTSGIQGNHSTITEPNLVDLALNLTYSSYEEILSKPELMQFAELKLLCSKTLDEICHQSL